MDMKPLEPGDDLKYAIYLNFHQYCPIIVA